MNIFLVGVFDGVVCLPDFNVRFLLLDSSWFVFGLCSFHSHHVNHFDIIDIPFILKIILWLYSKYKNIVTLLFILNQKNESLFI